MPIIIKSLKVNRNTNNFVEDGLVVVDILDLDLDCAGIVELGLAVISGADGDVHLLFTGGFIMIENLLNYQYIK